MSIEIETSTDTPEQVKEALGKAVEIDESDVPPEEKPPAKTPPKEESGEPSTEEESEEKEEQKGDEEEDEEPEEKAAAKPKKPAPDMVPRARLNEEIRKRKDAEAKVADRSKADEEPEPQKDERPQTFSGKPEPKLEDFTKNIDPYDNKAMSEATAEFTKGYQSWSREEARAEATYDRRQHEAEAERQEKIGPFLERVKATTERHPDYDNVVPTSKIQISGLMEEFIYESEIGPDLLYYLVEHSDETKAIRGMKARSQSKAMLDLEAKVHGEIEAASGDEGTVPPKKTVTPPAKKTSSAPPPATRLKSTGPEPKTEQQLAGTQDKTGVDIEFKPEYEKAVKARRST